MYKKKLTKSLMYTLYDSSIERCVCVRTLVDAFRGREYRTYVETEQKSLQKQKFISESKVYERIRTSISSFVRSSFFF